MVNFRYGRRGNTLKEGTKTPAALPKEKAAVLFSELENEKRKKGYQTENEVFMELPSLDAVEPDSINGAILQRLQDAVVGKNSFKTNWKTSRVIWRAGVLNLQEAIPFIIKLATRGDDMQTYSALWALIKLKAANAESLFSSLANNIKQKNHIVTLAWEGLFTIATDEEIVKLTVSLLEKMPAEISYAIETKDLTLLRSSLIQNTVDKQVDHVINLYVLAKTQPQLLPILNDVLKTWEFKPPYFRNIRGIYKLAQLRNDATMMAILFYRFEKEKAMFKRSGSLDSNQKRYVAAINQNVKVGAELKSKDSKLAFSNFTKKYFQENSIEFLKNTGAYSGASSYLKLAVNVLLQYKETDYTAAVEKPMSDYGKYDYKTKFYSYLLVNYPECSDSLLLTTILFGNDPSRKLHSNLKFITSSRTVFSRSYFYSAIQSEEGYQSAPNNSVIDTVKGIFKGLFGKKNPEATPVKGNGAEPEIPKPSPNKQARFELYPEHWDAMPEAYVQLLMQSQMNIIHRFAYERLKVHANYEEILSRFDHRGILQLLNSDFELPNQFGFEILKKAENTFAQQTTFVGQVLGSKNQQAREWAAAIVDQNAELYFNDIEFILSLIFNTRSESSDWIIQFLKQFPFSEDRIQTILGKSVAELLQLENTPDNNLKAKSAISRLNTITAEHIERISWTIVEQLITSPLDANKILAGSILLTKSKKLEATAIPVSLTELFLKDALAEVRKYGIELLNQYPLAFLVKNFKIVLDLIDSNNDEVSSAVFELARKLVATAPSVGNTIIPSVVYALMRTEKFEGAHLRISEFLLSDLKQYWNTGLQPKDLTKLLHAQYRIAHLAGYEILKAYDSPEDFSLRQIISFGSHEILAIRQWCWNYFKENLDRIRREKNQSLYLLDSKWEDTRAFAFHYFKTEFTAADWDPETLISIVDSIKPDVESFGKEMITRYFDATDAVTYLTKLSEHPSLNVQAFVSNYLSIYVKDNPRLLQELTFYFRSVLTRVNKARVAKDRIFGFLYNESLKDVETALWVVSILDDVSAQSTVQDKASCIDILTKIKSHYPELNMHLMIKN